MVVGLARKFNLRKKVFIPQSVVLDFYICIKTKDLGKD